MPSTTRFSAGIKTHYGVVCRGKNNVFIVANISLYFISGLVTKGYCYTVFSLGFLGLSGLIMELPLPSYGRLWYYLIGLGCHLLGLYFLLSSVVYWLHTVRP